MLKCQSCGQPATQHVTEIVAGKPVEYHVCETHVRDLDSLQPAPKPDRSVRGFSAFWDDAKLREALHDPAVRQEMAAHALPALCLALLHQKPEVRIAAACHLMKLGSDGRSAIGALRDALRDPDERVAKAAKLALEQLAMSDVPPPFCL